MKQKCQNLVELLSQRAEEKKEELLYTFLLDGEEEEVSLSYSQLFQESRALAALLQQYKAAGERALLLYPPGLDYIISFYACLFSKTVAVPAYPPDPNRLSRTLPRLISIIRDSEAKFILTTQSLKNMAEFLFQEAPELRELKWIATDESSTENRNPYQEISISSQDLAFLQYTSGSTGDPKGVMLSHENLLANLNLIYHAFGLSSQTKAVSWLPPYHDMGLIGGIIEPMYAGISAVLFSPLDFLQKPLRWLKAISKYRGTASGAPNFAYDLCVRKATPEVVQSLDLSSWDLAFSGAESVQWGTIQRFHETFAPCGFRKEAIYPCYGLAEATLIVSGGKKLQPFYSVNLDKKALENHRIEEKAESVLRFISCGRTLQEQEIVIVNPETFEELVAHQVGEIWVSGKSIAQSYWNKPEESKNIFQAYTKSGKGPFLRTGDFGFMQEGELYVTGRLKDLMILRGLNHYPQDIEHSLDQSDLGLRTGCGAAFSVSEDGEEKLRIVWEVNDLLAADVAELERIVSRMREVISKHHEIHVSGIVLIKKGSLPKTSSGKIQRQACKQAYFSGSLDILFEWKEKEAALPSPVTAPELDLQVSHLHNVKLIQDWLLKELSSRLKLDESEMDVQKSFTSYGIDSKEALGLAGDLEDWLQVKLSPTLFWQYPDIDRLAQYLSDASKIKT